jgi:hypothetical protein
MKRDTMIALRACLDAGVPVVLWGPPGTAKTALLVEEGARRGLPVHVVVLSHLEPTEVNGWLQPDVEAGVMRRLPPDWLADACARPVLLVLDELSCAPPAVQAAALRLIQERACGDRALHEGTRLVAAANPAADVGGAWDLTSPMANRLVHLRWQPDFASWAAWLSAHGPGTAEVRGQVVGYLQRAGAEAHLCVPPRDEAGAGGAWPSPRSWTALCAVLSALPARASFDAEALVAGGCVGPGEAVAFLAWRREADLPDPEALLRDPDGWSVPARHDRTYAALSAAVGAVASKLTPRRWEALLRLHRRALEAGVADLAAASAMVPLRWKLAPAPERRQELAKATLPMRDLEPFLPLLKAAGLLPGGAS